MRRWVPREIVEFTPYGITYFVGSGPNEITHVKIGRTDGQLKSRIKSLQTGNPHNLLVLATFPDSRLEEKFWLRFDRDRVRSEWFRYSVDIAQFLLWSGWRVPAPPDAEEYWLESYAHELGIRKYSEEAEAEKQASREKTQMAACYAVLSKEKEAESKRCAEVLEKLLFCPPA